MKKPIISLTSDFGVQSQGIGIMEGAIIDISPNAYVIHLMHGLPDFNTTAASRTMETVKSLPVGYHVCVVDPGVGTKRRAIIIKAKRGDYLIGPDNGVLNLAANLLGGCKKVVEITNPKYMRQPVSPIFHGKSVFCPAAAYLSKGIAIEKFGKKLRFEDLVKPPYEEACMKGDSIEAKVIHVNKYGSLNLNILQSMWDKFGVKKSQAVIFNIWGKRVKLPFVETFGDVPESTPLILKDSYGRIEVAINMGNFSKMYGANVGDVCLINKAPIRSQKA